MSLSKTIALASQLLKVDETVLSSYATDLESLVSLNATYYSIPDKGGASLIVSDEGEVLYAISSISFDDHLAAFRAGIRTPMDEFD